MDLVLVLSVVDLLIVLLLAGYALTRLEEIQSQVDTLCDASNANSRGVAQLYAKLGVSYDMDIDQDSPILYVTAS